MNLFRGMMVVALALSVATAAYAQRRNTSASMGGAKHEFGVDAGVAYVKPNGVDGGIAIQTPFDVRFGFVPRTGKLMWEPRVTLNFSSVGGNTTDLFTPQVNALFALSAGGHRRCMYFTGGAGHQMGDMGGGSGSGIKLESGVGRRKPYESAAGRYEVGFQWVTEFGTRPVC